MQQKTLRIGIASVRMDSQGKAFAQMLLDFPVPIPADLAL